MKHSPNFFYIITNQELPLFSSAPFTVEHILQHPHRVRAENKRPWPCAWNNYKQSLRRTSEIQQLIVRNVNRTAQTGPVAVILI